MGETGGKKSHIPRCTRNIIHIVNIDTPMTYYPAISDINTPHDRSLCAKYTAGQCTQRLLKGL